MVLWKDSFEKTNMELDLAKRKKHALDDLYTAGRISQGTYESLGKELNEEIEWIEARQKALAEKMTYKLDELEQQMQVLEVFLANSEMSYAAGEINEELHAQESNALSLGLEATKQELNSIKEVIIQLIPKEASTTTTPTPATTETPEAAPTEASVEKAPEVASGVQIEAPVEVTPVSEETKIEPPAPVPMEAATERTPQENPTEEGPAPFRNEGEETGEPEEKKEG